MGGRGLYLTPVLFPYTHSDFLFLVVVVGGGGVGIYRLEIFLKNLNCIKVKPLLQLRCRHKMKLH
jgi:hypothetical protein